MPEPINPERVRELLDAATSGPWRWTNTQEVYLSGARTKIVMAFSRMGMQGAQPEFRDELGLLQQVGRENINTFPDAALIAAAPDIAQAYLAERERAERALDGVRALTEELRDVAQRSAPALTKLQLDAVVAERDEWKGHAEQAEAAQCTCPWVDPKYWTTHYGAVDPASTQEYDPMCSVHGALRKRAEQAEAEVSILRNAVDQHQQHTRAAIEEATAAAHRNERAAIERAEKAEAAIARVRELHYAYVPLRWDRAMCHECEGEEFVPWPCDTIRALEGSGQ